MAVTKEPDKVTISREEYEAYVELTRLVRGRLYRLVDERFVEKALTRVIDAHNKRMKPQEQPHTP